MTRSSDPPRDFFHFPVRRRADDQFDLESPAPGGALCLHPSDQEQAATPMLLRQANHLNPVSRCSFRVLVLAMGRPRRIPGADSGHHQNHLRPHPPAGGPGACARGMRRRPPFSHSGEGPALGLHKGGAQRRMRGRRCRRGADGAVASLAADLARRSPHPCPSSKREKETRAPAALSCGMGPDICKEPPCGSHS